MTPAIIERLGSFLTVPRILVFALLSFAIFATIGMRQRR